MEIHISRKSKALNCKYNIEGPLSIKLLDEAQKSSLIVIYQKIKSLKTIQDKNRPFNIIKEFSTWHKHGNMQHRKEWSLFALQDRNIFL